jgi:hypothetical protein
MAGTAAALSPADKCEAAKNKVAGKYAFCRQKAEAKAIKTGDPVDYSTCDEKYSDKWTQAEATAGMGVCPTEGDETAMQSFITQHTDDVAAALNGGPLPDCPGDLATCSSDLATCNGSLGTCNASLGTCNANLGTCNTNLTATTASLATCNADLGTCTGDLTTCNNDLATCQAQPAGQRLRTGQTTCYNAGGTVIGCAGTGQDGELQKGLTVSYTDNGDGTSPTSAPA